MRLSRHKSGTTLVEVLIAVAFLAICAAAILDLVMTSNRQAAFALRRARVLDALEDALETVRGTSEKDTLKEGDTPVKLNLPGFSEPVTVTTSIVRRLDSRVLYDVSATATWNDPTTGKRGEVMSIATVVRDQ